MEKQKILIVGAEAIPFAKTGGLADVVGTLPLYLKKLGVDVRVILPFHGAVKMQYDQQAKTVAEFSVSVGGHNRYVGVRQMEWEGVPFYFIDNNDYFSGPIYKGGDAEGEQYAYFSCAVLESLEPIGFLPDVLHCNDWHTAVIPMLLKTRYQGRPYEKIGTLLTIHNMIYQGVYRLDFAKELLSVSDELLTSEYMEHWGMANFLKAGLAFADKINTVSPSYAKELQDPYYACGLEDLLSKRAADLSGILNGINVEEYNPKTDPLIEYPFHSRAFSGKRKNKVSLLKKLGLQGEPDIPMIAMVTRLTDQKGIDTVLEALPALMEERLTFVLLGSGDAKYEAAFRGMEERYKGRLCAYIGYDNRLAHQIYASSDLFLMPSKFEPCGISQMIAMRYGSLPIVRETGGLRDTVVPYHEGTGEGNGFSFTNDNAQDMLHVIRYALQTISDDKTKRKLMARAMGTDYSFSHSAAAYLALYREIGQTE